jgi:anion-transporting  ArsA/GET3 family ATPase
MNRGTKLAFKAFEKLAGSEFLSTLTDFFAAIRDWQKVLRDRTAEVHRLLTSSQTAFVLVTGFNAVKIEEARYFERTLKKGGYTLSAIIVNRAFPLWGQNEIGIENLHTNSEMNARVRVLIDYYNDLRSFYSDQMAAFESFQREMSKHVLFVRLPEFNEDVHDFNALAHVVERLKLAMKSTKTLS